VSADPDDDKFLACAIAARTPLIVSGDKHLLRVSGWRGMTVVTPRQCVDRYLAANEDAAPE
jgi:predicted nucleic acid-binding protein